MEYGCNVSNKFAFLTGGDDDNGEIDTAELVARAQKEKKEKAKQAKIDAKKAAAAPPPVKAVAAPTENNENRRPAQNQRRTGPRAPRDNADVMAERFGEKPAGDKQRALQNRDNRGPKRDGNRPPRREGEGFQRREGGEGFQRREGGEFQRRPRPPRDNEWSKDAPADENADGIDNAGQNRPPRRFNNRGGPRGAGGPRPDRVSGSDKTGVRSMPKRGGHGKGNWGDDKDELTGETEQAPQTEEGQPIKEGNEDNAAAGENAEKEADAVPEEPEAPKLTLSEWKAQQQKQEKLVFNTRKANEGVDQKTLQKFVPLKREEEEAKDEEEEIEIAATKRAQHQKTLNIDLNFADPSRGNRDSRGNRGGYQRENNNASYDRRGPRPGPGASRGRGYGAPVIDLQNDFPALGAH